MSLSSQWKKSSVANIVRYQPSGVYFARVRIGGKLIRQSLRTTILEVARPRLADLIGSAREQCDSTGRIAAGRLTFGDAAGQYLAQVESNPELKPRPRLYRAACLKAIRKTWPGIDELDVRRITKQDCMDWARRLRTHGTRFRPKGASKAHTGISPTRFNNTVATLRHVLGIAVEGGARHNNPAGDIPRARERKSELHLPSGAQFREFVRHIGTSGAAQAADCAELVRFLAFTGCRIGEVPHIRWSDVDWNAGELTVRGDPEHGTKTGEVRRVPLIPDARELLESMKAREADPAQPVLRLRECQKAMDRAARMTGMNRITHHDLRHFYATICIESGVDIPTVSRWLGHKDGGALAMRTYGHLRREHSIAQAQKVRFDPARP
ncbi:MAG: site-specific integrase [Verrucomicrobia bacterium]|nr:site-specific integrase [Verrucomicrobiota bacterium]